MVSEALDFTLEHTRVFENRVKNERIKSKKGLRVVRDGN